MHKPISITPNALADLLYAIDYYNKQLQDLGIRFEHNINNTFGKIQQMPKASSFAYERVRYKVVEDFPFIIIYEEFENFIAILRIFNTHQEPDKISEKK